MIHYATPYSTTKHYFQAIEKEFLGKKNEDWVFIIDGDAMFLNPNWGHLIENYINKYPDTGLFTCFASRCHYSWQVPLHVDMNNDSLLYHKRIAVSLEQHNDGKVREMPRGKRVAGHLMGIKTETWRNIFSEVSKKVLDQNKKVLGVDTKITNALIKFGYKIRLMQSVYMVHFCRLDKGFGYTQHLT